MTASGRLLPVVMICRYCNFGTCYAGPLPISLRSEVDTQIRSLDVYPKR
jgi:hypothetical protein